MQTFLQDVRYGFRMLTKTPGFTAVAIITLALAIGANSAIFSVVNTALLRPFPFHQPDRLAVVWERQSQRGLPFMFASPPNYADWREQNQVFEEIAAFDPRGFFLKQADESVRVQGARVTASLFSTLRVPPLAGRVFDESEDRPNAPRVVVLGYALWRDRFGADRNLIGQAITINEESHTVIGVMPPAFKFPPPINLEGGTPDQKTDLWVPFALDMKTGQRGAHFMRVIARLKPGVTLDRANTEMNAIAARLEQSFSDTNKGWDIAIVPLNEQVLGEIRPALIALMAAVGFVLLIACVNIANLMLARGAARQKEMAIRSALGAGRWRIVRQLITESLLLALAGGAAGLLVANTGIDILIRFAPRDVPRLEDAAIDGAVMGFALAVSLLTGFLFGLAPALQTFSLDLNQWLKEGGRSSSEGGRMRLRGALVVVEVALSMVLLVGAGLLFQSFLRLSSVETGFETKNALTMRMTLPQSRFSEREQKIAAYREMEGRIRSLAEIEAAGFVLEIPLAADRQGTSLHVEGRPLPEAGEESHINFTFTTPGYFDAMGIPVLKGRTFNDQDSTGSQNVVIINSTLARRFFPDEDPIGKHVYVGFQTQIPRLVVGIVGDERHISLRDEPTANAYVPYYQVPWSASMSLVARTRSETASALTAIREQAGSVVPGLPVYEVKTMEQVITDSLAHSQFSTFMLLVFSGAAVLLAATGIYGFISFIVAQQTREIGIRCALGAGRKDIFKMILGRGARLALAGAGIGLAAAFALTRLMKSLLFEVSPSEPTVYIGLSLLLTTVVMAACVVPARRATKVDPQVALRCE